MLHFVLGNKYLFVAFEDASKSLLDHQKAVVTASNAMNMHRTVYGHGKKL